MKRIFDEGIRQFNNKPLPIDCLIMSHENPREAKGEPYSWDVLHYHKYIELLYAVEGGYEVYINGDVQRMPQGHMVVINAGELHATRATGQHNTEVCIKFVPEILFSSEQTVTEMEYSIPYVFEHFGYRRCFEREQLAKTFLPEAFLRVKQEHEEKAFGYELAIRAEVMRIFAWILRYWHDEADAKDIPAQRENDIIRRAREYVQAYYADATLQGAAEHCGLSYSYFSRLFMRCMKMRFSQYVNLVRVNQSMKELALSDRSITEIALTCGFSSTSYYIQTFRQLKHTSPNQFRRSFRKETQS